MSPLRLFAVSALDGHGDHAPVPGTTLVAFRDVGAVVAEIPAARPPEGRADLDEHRRVVDGAFAHGAILPAPPGVAFRSRDVLMRWLELHYVTLSDALGFVEGRVGARVHVSRAGESAPLAETAESPGDIAAIAAGSFRVLRRHAVASVPLKVEHESEVVASAAFLVDRERWQVFADVVKEEDRRLPDLTYEVTGPWPPYDFVRMQFGG